MVTSQIKTAKSGYDYLRIEKNGKAFCIFETQDYIILDIAIQINSISTLEDIQKKLNDDTYIFFLDSYKNRHNLKEEMQQYDEIDDPYVALCHHDKPDFW
jgi:two-component SAPR family response regulator